MDFAREEIQGVVEAVFDSTLALSISTLPAPKDLVGSHKTVTSVLHITGAWEGAVVLELSAELGRKAASAMFAMEEAEVCSDEIRDTVGELVNMVGGNIKALLPSPSQVSLPTVVEGQNYTMIIPGATCITKIYFESAGEPFAFTLLRKNS